MKPKSLDSWAATDSLDQRFGAAGAEL